MHKVQSKPTVARKVVRQSKAATAAPGRRLLFSLLSSRFTRCVLVFVGLMVAATYLWERLSLRFVEQANLAISAEKIEISPANSWVPEQPRDRLLAIVGSARKNLLDKDLVEFVAAQLGQLPYVESVRKVEKTPQGLNIQAVYREPVALVELGNERFQKIDRQAIQIGIPEPANEENDDWLRVNVHQPKVLAAEWGRIEDERIEIAAQICHELRRDWRELGLYRVVFYWPVGTRVSDETPFEIWTANGSRILWCNGTSDRRATSAQKIEALKNWVTVNGSLERLAGWRMIDVRTGQVLLVPETRASFNWGSEFLK